MYPRNVRLLAAFCFLLVSGGLGAQPRVLLASSPSQAPVLADIAARTVNLEIIRAGLRIEQWVHPDAESGNLDTVLKKAEETGSQFVFLKKLTMADGIVDSDFSFINAKTGETVLRRRVAFPFDLNLDSRIAREIRGLLSESEVREAVEAASADMPVKPPAEIPPPAKIPAAPAVQPQPVVPVLDARPSIPERGFIFDLSAAPVLVFGEMSELFPYGFAASAFGGYRFTLMSLPFETGLRLGAVRIFPDPAVTKGSVYSVLAGIGVRAEIVSAAKLSLAFRASAGPAVVAADVPDESLMAKTVAYADGGISATARISRGVELGMELGYLSVFEGDYPIMGFMPTIAARFFP